MAVAVAAGPVVGRRGREQHSLGFLFHAPRSHGSHSRPEANLTRYNVLSKMMHIFLVTFETVLRCLFALRVSGNQGTGSQNLAPVRAKLFPLEGDEERAERGPTWRKSVFLASNADEDRPSVFLPPSLASVSHPRRHVLLLPPPPPLDGFGPAEGRK